MNVNGKLQAISEKLAQALTDSAEVLSYHFSTGLCKLIIIHNEQGAISSINRVQRITLKRNGLVAT